MTPPDAGQAKPSSQNTRLIEDLRKCASSIHGMIGFGAEHLLRSAADEIERLRGVEDELKRKLAQERSRFANMEEAWSGAKKYHEILQARIVAAVEVLGPITASRSTGAADVGENHG